MRKLILIFILLTGLLLAACNSQQPSIALETTKLDLGHVINGEAIISHKLIVRNEGNADLVVDSVTTSCGCTQANLTPMTIAPGESGTLTIEFDSGAHGPELTGQLIRQIFVTSNDPELPEVEVELAVFVDPNTS